MNKKNLVIAIIIIVILLGVVIYGQINKKENSDFKIGIAAALTGDANEWGQGELNVFKMLVDDLNNKGGIAGRNIEFVVEDTKSTNVGTVDAVMKLTAIDKVPVILGPTWGDSFQGGYPIAEQNKTALITPSAAFETVENKNNFTYSFSTWWPQLPEIDALQKFMNKNNFNDIVVINDHDAFNTKAADIFEENAKQNNIKILDRVQIPIGEKDFRTIFVKIKKLQPRAIFVEMQDVSQIGPFMKQAKELGIDAKIFSTSAGQNEDAVKKFGQYMEGFTYSFVKSPSGAEYDDFIKEYESRYNQKPSGPSVLNAYNAITILIKVIENGAETGTEIRDSLYKIKTPGLGVSEISFNDNGQIGLADFEIKTVHNNKFEIVK